MKYSINVNIQFNNGAIQFNYILINFLTAGSLLITERGVLKSPTIILDLSISLSNYIIGFVYFSLEFFQLLPQVF